MVIDWQASKEQWIADVERDLVPSLSADGRFIDSPKIITRFRDAAERWRQGGDIRQLINDGNELAAAAKILEILQDGDRLYYEPRLAATPKTIDFMIEQADRSRSWCDFKTVAPQWQDDEASWRRFEAIAAQFPENAKLIVDRNLGGAAISGQFLKARWSFIQRTVEAEEKAVLLQGTERGPVRLLLCSSGAWNQDDLEDFADFYRSGHFREDDWARNAMARYMADEGINFARNLAGFGYVERQHDEVEARHFVLDVRGPPFGK